MGPLILWNSRFKFRDPMTTPSLRSLDRPRRAQPSKLSGRPQSFGARMRLDAWLLRPARETSLAVLVSRLAYNFSHSHSTLFVSCQTLLREPYNPYEPVSQTCPMSPTKPTPAAKARTAPLLSHQRRPMAPWASAQRPEDLRPGSG